MYCTGCYTSVENGQETCPGCGATLSDQPQTGLPPLREEEPPVPSSSRSVSLSEATAVSVACPHCEARPVEEVATGQQLTSFLVDHQADTYTFVGCHRCVRGKLLSTAGTTALLGWWGLLGLFVPPFVVLWNVARGCYNRGPNRHLVEELVEATQSFSLLADPEAFDAEAYHPLDGHVRGLARLAVAAAQSGGTMGETQRDAIRDGLAALAPDYPPSSIDIILQQVAEERLDAEGVAAELASALTPGWKRSALQLVSQVYQADSVPGDPDLMHTLAEHMGVEGDDVGASL
ncbi:MAG: hypothetical protein BRD55_02320 [Bacteroidetes bacterium SW_9_63_38]|nr:MAG: hypothetical protein BRD55_02320 [Bacteroidetes bacterium SW_9_63_38]